MAGGVVAHDIDDGLMRLTSIVQKGNRIGKTRPQMQQSGGRLAHHAGIAIGSARHHAFGQTENATHARLAIQRGDKELWAGRLFGKGVTATPTGVDGVHVGRGQAIYFRLQTGEQATVDRVSWDPKIHYTGYDDGDEGPGTDVNGRSERTFKASEDFTLAGRPAVKLPAPLEGTVHFEGTLKIARKLTDDVSVVLEKNGQDILRRTVRSGDTLTAGELLKAD